MRDQKQFHLLFAVVILMPVFLTGCSLLSAPSDTPSQDSILSDQPIIQPDAYRDIYGGGGPGLNSDGFMGGFSGSPKP